MTKPKKREPAWTTDEELVAIESRIRVSFGENSGVGRMFSVVLTECRRARAAEGAKDTKLRAVVQRQAGDFCIGCQKELNTATEGGGA